MSKSVVPVNMSLYVAQSQILRNEIERQEDNLIYRIKNLDNYRQKNEPQLTIHPDGDGRSGFMKMITATDSRAAGLWSIHQNDELTSKWKKGDFYDPSSGSGTKIPIIHKAYRAVEENVCVGCMTSNYKSPLAQIVANQVDGVKELTITSKGGRKIQFEGFEKTVDQKKEFKEAYPWFDASKSLVIEVPGRERAVGKFEENTGLSPGGNFYEWGTRFVDDVSIASYKKWKMSGKRISIKKQLEKFSYEYSEAVRKTYPVIMNQMDRIDKLCNDISSEDVERLVISAEGERSGIEGKSLAMRVGGHGGMNVPGKFVTHLKSTNKPIVQKEIENIPIKRRKNNVRGIVISQSLETGSRETAEWLTNLRIPTYLFTSNIGSEIAKRNRERCIEIPKMFSYVIQKKPTYEIFPLTGLMTYDSIAADFIKRSKHTVSEMHRED
ncbi:MAG: hypothetical protein V1818_01970 [Candidatus Aenigmatarchaeota archaeon]